MDNILKKSALLQIVDASLPRIAATRPNTALALWGARGRPGTPPLGLPLEAQSVSVLDRLSLAEVEYPQAQDLLYPQFLPPLIHISHTTPHLSKVLRSLGEEQNDKLLLKLLDLVS